MVTLTKIYTRGGDKGETSLGSGERVPKHSLRVSAYGTSDEANAIIGITRLHTEGAADEMLSRIQNDLFDLGADLCTPEGTARKNGALRITNVQVERLEREIDELKIGKSLGEQSITTDKRFIRDTDIYKDASISKLANIDEPSGVNPEAVYAETNFALSDAKM